MGEYEEELDVCDDNINPVMEGSGEFETIEKPKINPKYDEKLSYVPRKERLECCCASLLRQLPPRNGGPVVGEVIAMPGGGRWTIRRSNASRKERNNDRKSK